MLTVAQAAADKLLFNVEGLKYVVTTLPKGGLDEPVAGGEWNPREVRTHLTAYLDLQGGILERVVAGESPFPDGFSLTEFHETTPDGGATGVSTNLPDLLAALAAARDRLTNALGTLTAEHLSVPIRGGTISTAIARWPAHVAAHGLHIVVSFREFHIGPFTLNWLLPISFENQDEQAHQEAIRLSGKALLDELEVGEE